jgi:hypothetical protein
MLMGKGGWGGDMGPGPYFTAILKKILKPNTKSHGLLNLHTLQRLEILLNLLFCTSVFLTATYVSSLLHCTEKFYKTFHHLIYQSVEQANYFSEIKTDMTACYYALGKIRKC